MVGISLFFFFFQAEDGIRDLYVTGVQTCALPICPVSWVQGSPDESWIARRQLQIGLLRVLDVGLWTLGGAAPDSASHQNVLPQTLDLDVIESRRRRQGKAVAANAAGSPAASEDARCEKDCHAVHSPRAEEFPERGRSAFDQKTRDPLVSEPSEQNRDAHAPGAPAAQAPHGHAAGEKPADRRALRWASGGEDHAFGIAEEARVFGDPEMAVQHNPPVRRDPVLSE